MNNRTLLYIFAGCLLLFVAGKLFRANKTSSFDPVIIKTDTAKVDRLVFSSPGEQGETFELKRKGDHWEAVKDNFTVTASAQAVNRILGSINDLEGKRIVTKEAAHYPEYEIDDQKGVHLQVYAGPKSTGDIVLGGFRFDQATRSATSFIKRTDQPEVFEVDGFTSMALKGKFDQFRDRKLVNTPASELARIDWSDQEGHKASISKDGNEWHYAGMEPVDTAAFSTYLSSLESAQGSEFSPLTSREGLPLVEQVQLFSQQMTEPTVVAAYASQDTAKPYLIWSSINPEALFRSDTAGLYKRIFSDLRPFWPNGK